jgi:hypothetical protein
MQTECPLKGGHSGGDSNGTFRSNEAKPVYLGAGSKARFQIAEFIPQLENHKSQ